MDQAGSAQTLLSVLGFWHKVEFFIPFDLQSQLNKAADGRVRRYYADSLHSSSNDLWNVLVPSESELRNFYLYLGAFDRSEIVRSTAVLSTESEISEFDELERTALDGLTCCARITVSPLGELPLGSDPHGVEISTLPWALGQLRMGGLSELTQSAFRQAKVRLSAETQNFRAAREAGPLCPDEVLALYHIICSWCSFRPSDNKPVAIIEACFKKKRKRLGNAETKEALSSAKTTDDEAEDEVEPRIGILNSFFIEDIERAMDDVRRGLVSPALERYLRPFSPEQRIDLESSVGLNAIIDAVHPSRLNRGRWFTDVRRAMSLMQQFAIDTALPSVNPPALFSVNGPPGTGKTTLLQDVMADLMVRRARVLSRLNDAKSAFELDSPPVHFEGVADPIRMLNLKPELTGFEMVVVSSNNRAVENVSADFLKVGNAIGTGWADAASYLQPVAHKIAAQNLDGTMERLPPAEQPWGLLACKLGKWSNRYAFKEKFAFLRVERGQQESLSSDLFPQTIYEWIDSYRGPDFHQAASAFLESDAAVERELASLEIPAALLRRSLVDPGLEDCASANQEAEKAYSACAAERLNLQIQLEEGIEDERLLKRISPGWWALFRRTPAAGAYRIEVRENAVRQRRTRSSLAQAQKAEAAAQRAAEAAGERLRQAQHEQESSNAARETLLRDYPGFPLPKVLADLNTDEIQKNGLWHTEELARLRTSLFSAALALHEAWLADVGRKKESAGGAGFRANIMAVTKLLSNKAPERPSAALAAWQSLFMMVPVVSTTFASFGNQFRDVPSGSLGWVFIDEAGQALPQAAVGALWRAQHAIVVGDPLQIEPVFTLPSRFISAIAALSPVTACGSYSPHRTSVQRLADAANRYGTSFHDEAGAPSLWVGSPLRVHRRCIYPMFPWANHISYNGKMVFGLPHEALPDGPPLPIDSLWIQMQGQAANRQAVPAQTHFVVGLLRALYLRDGHLPCLYVISPFRAVKDAISQTLLDLDWPSGLTRRKLRHWCRSNIGTVHTFQGKEEDSVLLVLGADADQRKAAEWAASRPNLLNVALTRARRRVYILGDRQVWGSLGSFRWAHGRIASMPAEQFPRSVLANTGEQAAAQNV